MGIVTGGSSGNDIEIRTVITQQGAEELQKLRNNIRLLENDLTRLNAKAKALSGAAPGKGLMAERAEFLKGRAELLQQIGEKKIELKGAKGALVDFRDTQKVASMDKTIKEISKTGRELTTVYKNAEGQIIKTIRTTEEGMQRFKFLGLNFLFFGMFLQRVFGGILQSGINTFREITETASGSTKAISAVAAAGTFLAFTIGDALNTILEPLLPTIIGIVNKTADFIQQHPGIVVLVAAVAALGAAFLILGTFMVFFQNVSLSNIKTLANLGTAMGDLGAYMAAGQFPMAWATLISNLLLVGVILAVLVIGWDYWAKAAGKALAFVSDAAHGEFGKAQADAMDFFALVLAGALVTAQKIGSGIASITYTVLGFITNLLAKVGAAAFVVGEQLGALLSGQKFDFSSELDKAFKAVDATSKEMFDRQQAGLDAMSQNWQNLVDEILLGKKAIKEISGIPNLYELPEAKMQPINRFDLGGQLRQQGNQTVNLGGLTINISTPAINTDIDFKKAIKDPIIDINRDISNALVGTSRIS